MLTNCGADVAGSETPGISTRVFVTIQGRQQSLWRAVDEVGDVLDILVQPRRNRHAAVRFFRKLLKNHRHVPRRLITDTLRSYSAACRTVMPSVLHCTDQDANNRAEVSHHPTRQRERQMRRFTSAAQLQRFASVHGIVQHLFRVGRHLLRSAHHRSCARCVRTGGTGTPPCQKISMNTGLGQPGARRLSVGAQMRTGVITLK